MSLKSEQQWTNKCLLVRRAAIRPHCGCTREEKRTFNGLQGNVILGDALRQECCARAISRTAQLAITGFFFLLLAVGFAMTWLIVHCMLSFSFILRQCSIHCVHLCLYTPNDSSENRKSSPEYNVQWELGLSPAVLAANVVIMHFIQVLVITSQGTGVWALFVFFCLVFSGSSCS